MKIAHRHEQFKVDGPKARPSTPWKRCRRSTRAPSGRSTRPWCSSRARRRARRQLAAETRDASSCSATRRADLRARTPNQAGYLDNIAGHDITFGIGPAGTGKTYLAVACAVDALERSAVQRIVLTRPAVEAGERLGFLPGDLAQKVDPYLRPLYDALYDLMGFDRVRRPSSATARDRAAGLHARAHAQQRLRDPRRGAEHHARADEDVPHPHRLRRQGGGDGRREPDRPAPGSQRPGRRRTRAERVKGIATTRFTRPTWCAIRWWRASSRPTTPRDARGGLSVAPARSSLSLQFARFDDAARHRAALPRHASRAGSATRWRRRARSRCASSVPRRASA